MSLTASENEILSTQYQMKTDIQHVLETPDTYVGSIELTENEIFVYDETSQRLVPRMISMVPCLYKVFDEALTNARDHVCRMLQSTQENKHIVTQIDVEVQPETGTVVITNDGTGIDVCVHPQTNIWIPEMIFGHLRTSTNYNKEEKKIVGGKNGFGIKLVIIWSTYAKIETIDHVRGLLYVQEFGPNLSVIHPPKITPTKKKPYTRVTFTPDYQRLGLTEGLTPDMTSLLKKRTMDIAAVTDHSQKKVKVTWNGQPVPVKNFQQYIDLYLGPKEETKRVYEESGERWEYGVAISPTHEFQQVSFVNGIATRMGGKHIDHVLLQITKKVTDYIEKKKKIKVNPSSIKEQLWLFLRCDIENPSFDSQTKDYMNTSPANFGSKCVVSDAFAEKVAKLGIMDLALTLTEAKENKLAKKTDGTKTKSVRGIANLVDANYSGTAKSRECTLILCEGLSALSGVVSGLSSADRNIIGIYPLKGKPLNVRGEATKKISENKEISDLKKILGLETGKEYTQEDVNTKLRYGKVMVLADSDLDGAHIKALVINVFHSEWPSLAKISGFLSFMNTPILRATKRGQPTQLFYNEGEYHLWKSAQTPQTLAQWTLKYFKGLGTSTSTEFKEYFANKKYVAFQHSGAPSDECIDKVFNKKRPDDRKTWLENYDKHAYLDTNQPVVTYENFIDKELIHFSTYDCARSIPNMVDGLKISLRKILYCAFKRKLTQEIKVAQFSGYVSEHSAYHHGEASLNGAIVNMAQDFVGSNNIHLLEPKGQFGTRFQGGGDSASERYIFTHLSPLARGLFPEQDDAILQYMDDDGMSVEPEYYIPVIPFVLVNGISGIGTGFSSSIPSYRPQQLSDCLKHMLRGQQEEANAMEFIPFYQGFRGTVQRVGGADASKYLIKGVYVKLGEDKIRITELPIGTWTMPYVAMLEEMLEPTVAKDGKKTAAVLKDITNLSTEKIIDITVVFPKGQLVEWEQQVDANGINGVEKHLKLTTSVSTTNMHLFDAECKLHKYQTVHEIIQAFFPVRYGAYVKRKTQQLNELARKQIRLSNRARYITETLEGKVDLRRKQAEEVRHVLSSYAKIDDSYDYLTKMPMDSVTSEMVTKIMREKGDNEEQQRALEAKTVEQIWLEDLTAFDVLYGRCYK